MLEKFSLFMVVLILVFCFYFVISLGAGVFSKKEKRQEIQKYLKSVNILLIFIIIVGAILTLFL
jgi:ABC-type Na+ efflux pump permease subunit